MLSANCCIAAVPLWCRHGRIVDREALLDRAELHTLSMGCAIYALKLLPVQNLHLISGHPQYGFQSSDGRANAPFHDYPWGTCLCCSLGMGLPACTFGFAWIHATAPFWTLHNATVS